MDANFIEPTLLIDRLDSHYYEARFYNMEKKIISSDYLIKELGAICEKVQCGPFGSSVLAENYDSEGIVMVRPVNLKGVLLSNEDLVRFPEKALPSNSPKFKMGDVLFARVGTPSCSIVTREIGTVTISPNIIAAKLKDNVDKHYITTFLNTVYGSSQIERRFKAVSQPTVSTDDVRTLKVIVPTRKIQHYIGNKVRKAEKFQEEAKKLMLEAETIFKSLFKDDCVYNNNAGNPSIYFNQKPIYISVSEVEINERLDAQSFHPELFQTINKIKLLEFKTIRLQETIEFHDTGISSPQYADFGTPVIMTKNIKNSSISQVDKYVVTDTISESNLLATDDVLFTTYGGPSIGKVDIFFGSERSSFDYTILRLRFKKKFDSYFMLLLLRSKYVQNQVRYMIKGTTGITFVNPKDVLNVIIPVVPLEVQNEIGFKIKRSHNNVYRSMQLIAEAKQDVEDLIEGKFDESKIFEEV